VPWHEGNGGGYLVYDIFFFEAEIGMVTDKTSYIGEGLIVWFENLYKIIECRKGYFPVFFSSSGKTQCNKGANGENKQQNGEGSNGSVYGHFIYLAGFL